MINFNNNKLYNSVSNVSGTQFNINMSVLSVKPYFYAINNNVVINILNQILINSQQDLMTLQSYNVNFLPTYTATQILLKGKLFTDPSLKVQDFFDYIVGKISITSVLGDNYYTIANSSIYTVEYQKFTILLNNLKDFYNFIILQQNIFNKYYVFFNIYNNFLNQFSEIFFQNNYSEFSVAYNNLISKIRDSFSVSGQIYATSNEQNIIKITKDWFSVNFISDNLYSIALNQINLPNGTTIRFYNDFIYTGDNVNMVSGSNLLANEVIADYLSDNNIINSDYIDRNDYIVLPTDRTRAYAFMLDNVTKKISLSPDIVLNEASNQNGSASSFIISKRMSNVLLNNQPADIVTNFNYYTKTFLESNMIKYYIGDIRYSNANIEDSLPNYYIKIYKNRILPIQNYSILYNEIYCNLTFEKTIGQKIYNIVIKNSKFDIRGNNIPMIKIGTQLKSLLQIHNVINIGIDYIELDGDLTNITSYEFINHSFIFYEDIDNMVLCKNFDNRLPMAGIDDNVFSSETKESIILQPNNIPSFNYTGVNPSLYGEPKTGTPIVIPGTTSDVSPIKIKKVEANGLINETLGNISPTDVNIKQKVGILYDLFLKIL